MEKLKGDVKVYDNKNANNEKIGTIVEIILPKIKDIY